jgi:hypothetical protein
MGHALVPNGTDMPAVSEIVRRLRVQFAHVIVDAEAGAKRARAMADQVERVSPNVLPNFHAQMLAHAAQMRELPIGDAVVIAFGDSADLVVTTFVATDNGIKFGYGSREEERLSRPLIDRCARALDCKVELF